MSFRQHPSRGSFTKFRREGDAVEVLRKHGTSGKRITPAECAAKGTSASLILPGLIHLSLILLAACFVMIAPSARADTFLADSSDNTVWLICSRVDLEGEAGLVFVCRASGAPFEIPRMIRAQQGQIKWTAVVGDRLHAFFVNQGQHIGYSPRVGVSSQGRLPDRYVPLAVAADSANGSIYAIVPTWLALKIPVPTTEPASQPTGLSVDQPASSPANATPSETPPPPPPTTRPDGYALVVHSGRTWRMLETIPYDTPVERGHCFVGVVGDAIHVLARSGRRGPIHHAVYENGKWTSQPTFGQDWNADLDRLFVVPSAANGRLVLLGTRETNESGHVAVQILVRSEEKWSAPIPIYEDNVPLIVESDTFSAAVVEDRLALFRQEQEQRVFLAEADLTGRLVQPFASVPLFEPFDKPTLSPQIKSILTPAVLLTVLLVLYWRREDGILEPVDLPRGIRVAPTWTRFVGLVVDLAPAILVTLPMWYSVIMTQRINWAEIFRDPTSITISLYGTCWLTRVLYATYCGVFEAMLGKTPGKMLTGSWIIDEHSNRLSTRAALVRNLFRLVETEPLFSIWWVVILIWLTRNHQRLGDILARTIVVQSYTVYEEIDADQDDADQNDEDADSRRGL